MVNHPKEVENLARSIDYSKTRIKRNIEEQLKEFNEDCDRIEESALINEIRMMHAARKTPTPNELIEEELDAIERMKRDRVVTVND